MFLAICVSTLQKEYNSLFFKVVLGTILNSLRVLTSTCCIPILGAQSEWKLELLKMFPFDFKTCSSSYALMIHVCHVMGLAFDLFAYLNFKL
jgi:Na+-transporting NADH:ubiquinone oxidoreductase subunit NqrD